MKLTVKSCVKSYKYDGVYVVTYTTTKINFFTNEKVVTEKKLISVVEVPVGEVEVVTDSNKEQNKFWIKEVKKNEIDMF